MAKISVVISTKDNMATLPRILDACAFADEVVLVDDYSHDKSYEFACQHPVMSKAYQRAFDRPALHRMHLCGQSTGDWILVLDGDEIPSPELGPELRRMSEQDRIPCFRVPQKYVPPAHWKSTAYYTEHQLRFFRRDTAEWVDEPGRVHTPARTQGPIKKLRAGVRHESFDNLQHFVTKQLRYGLRSGAFASTQGQHASAWAPALRYLSVFLKYYLLKGLFRFGGVGFTLAHCVALQSFAKYAAIWEPPLPSNTPTRQKNMAEVLEDA